MNGKALLIVIDGSGVDRARIRKIANATWDELAGPDRRVISEIANQVARSFADCPVDTGTLARLALYPTRAEALDGEMQTHHAKALLSAIGDIVERPETQAPLLRARQSLRRVARELRYVPWAADAPLSARLRNRHVTVPTSAAGEWAGFEPLDPPVQGNSETGHQQIGNLVLAPQLPLEISNVIDSGAFFENRVLRAAVEHGAKPGSALNVAFMLSGAGGRDGRVHSAWNHLEAFLELVFARIGMRPDKVRIQAILDGRDSPPRASLERRDGIGGYLDRLEDLLDAYSATGSLAWVVGRSTGMDRDYREVNARDDYLLLTAGDGVHVDGFRRCSKSCCRSAPPRSYGPGRAADSRQRAEPTRVEGRTRPGIRRPELSFRPPALQDRVTGLAQLGSCAPKANAEAGTGNWTGSSRSPDCTSAE